MAESDRGSEAERLVIAGINTVAAITLVLGAIWAAGPTAGEAAFHYFTLGKSILCGLAAATAAGVASGLLYRHLYRQFGTVAALSGLLAIPLFSLPEWTLAVIGVAVGGLAILVSVRWINRRDDPHINASGTPPSPPVNSN